jgi:hypothetical protein
MLDKPKVERLGVSYPFDDRRVISALAPTHGHRSNATPSGHATEKPSIGGNPARRPSIEDIRMQDTTRYLLARPSSGFVDILNQIVTSFEWARVLKRHLVVDCRWGNWRDDLSYYFDVRSEHAADVSLRLDDANLMGLSVHPALLADLQDRSYRRRLVRDDAEALRITHAETGLDLSSYDVPDCRQDVIVHHPIGGGHRATDALRMLTLTADLRRVIGEVMAGLPRAYNAIHLRNTDLVADLADARTRIASLDPAVPILVASDNSASLSQISQICPENHFFSIARIFSADGKPLHSDQTLAPRERNIEALVDLIALASSACVVLPKIVSGSKPDSGYSRLAKDLQDDSALLSQLVSPDGTR